MESRYIVAVEIGSSKIKGIVAAVDEAAGITVIAVEETDSADSVRHGRVQNAREVGIRVNEIIRRLENNPRLANGTIRSVYVSNGGRSVVSRPAQADISLGGDVEITAMTLEKLHKEARYNLATDRDVLAISDRRFTVDGTEVKKIVGTFGSSVRGEFTIVTVSPENRRNLERVRIESRGTDIPRQYIPRPVALADMLLSDSERQLGSVLIDFGAETTTLAVYRDNALQLMATLPMGGVNITRDLSTGLGVTVEVAENIKMTKGRAVAERLKNMTADDESAEIVNYVSARAGEIIANVVNYLEHADIKIGDLPGGIVITGGGSQLAGLDEMLATQTKAKVRHAAIDATIGGAPYNTVKNADVIAMVRYAAAQSADTCLVFADTATDTAETERGAAAQGATGRPTVRTTERPAQTYTPAQSGTRRAPALDDPGLLHDDPDDILVDPVIDDDELPTPEKGESANVTRKRLLERLKTFFTKPTEDDDLDSTGENDLD